MADSALKMTDFALKMTDFALKMTEFALKMMDSALKMTDFSLILQQFHEFSSVIPPAHSLVISHCVYFGGSRLGPARPLRRESTSR